MQQQSSREIFQDWSRSISPLMTAMLCPTRAVADAVCDGGPWPLQLMAPVNRARECLQRLASVAVQSHQMQLAETFIQVDIKLSSILFSGRPSDAEWDSAYLAMRMLSLIGPSRQPGPSGSNAEEEWSLAMALCDIAGTQKLACEPKMRSVEKKLRAIGSEIRECGSQFQVRLDGMQPEYRKLFDPKQKR